MRNKYFTLIVFIIAIISFIIAFSIAIKFVNDNKEHFTVDIQPSAIITPEELQELLNKENK